MSYQVIARKWRPQTFEDVIGQEAITRTLRNAIEHDRLHHAYLFSGARGVGKTTTARLLAKALNCRKTDTPNPIPCEAGADDACVSCQEIAASRSLDVLEFDAASHTKVDEIREIILESININPARDRYKVFIIDEVHMLSTSSFNALLKTLEEPPAKPVFIMATTELHKLPDTILSRCQQFDFRTIALQKIAARLKLIAEAEEIDVSSDALREIARSGEGSMRDAQSNFDQVISFSGETIDTEDVIVALGIASAANLTKTIDAIANKDSASALHVVEDLAERGQDLRNFSRDLLTFVRDLLIVKIAGDSEHLLESAILGIDELKAHSAPFLESDLIRFFNSIAETESRMRDATEPRYILEIGLIKLIEMRKIAPIENILERLSKIEGAVLGAPENSKSVNPPGNLEKKTLTREVPPKDIPFPVKSAPGSMPDVLEKEVPTESTGRSPEIPERESPPENIIPDTPENDPTEPPKIARSIKSFIRIDPESMPVRLEPISSEDLEHVEDKKLDAEFEDRLLREGDDLQTFQNSDQLMDLLLDRSSDRIIGDQGNSFDGGASGAAATATAKENKALDIVSQMRAIEETDETIPVLAEDPTEEQLIEFAESHPLVRKVKRVFRGKITAVTRPD
ncbi:MAG: DNA polymerase III subunit gamma/tau [Acidobacteria bacterium]|nr:DNA polymerase III subunit gamma/tau [Acidobacteriota bacterium]